MWTGSVMNRIGCWSRFGMVLDKGKQMVVDLWLHLIIIVLCFLGLIESRRTNKLEIRLDELEDQLTRMQDEVLKLDKASDDKTRHRTMWG